jgi:hypothetical protein
MKRLLFAVGVAGVVSLPIGCNPFAPDQSVVLGVSKLDAPTTISPGRALTVVLTVTTGGCLSFDHIDVERSGSAASLTAVGHDAAKGRTDIACTQEIRSESHSFRLDPPFENPFTVEVNRGRVSPLIAVVNVQ